MEKLELELVENHTNYPYTYNTDWGYAYEMAGLTEEEVDYVYAADEGENDGQSWICAGKLKDGRWFFLASWCDYTGWDCQAGGELFTSDSKEELERMHMGDNERSRLGITLPPMEGEGPILFKAYD